MKKTTEARAEHTPGPWEFHGEIIHTTNQVLFTVMNHLSDSAMANGSLAAAAPELLATCRKLLRLATGYAVSAGDDSLCTKQSFAQARAAIAKAEGR